ncbi:MAG: rod shape-determining protein [Actinobacteria bacterium]|nr:rod shape-determining protein [Actinomycetota bacterium]
MQRLVAPLGRDLGIDLGTANTVIVVRGQGVALTQPSYVAVDREEGRIIAFGAQAKEMMGRVPEHIEVIRPLRAGVITDFEAAQAMLRTLIQRVHRRRRLVKPRVVVCVPSGVTQVEERAVEEAVVEAGARRAVIVTEPLAAALGAGLPVDGAKGSMVVDVGGGTTEVAAFSLGAMVVGRSARVGGDAIDLAIAAFLRKHHGILVGERSAERIKWALASAAASEEPPLGEILGRDVVDGRPRRVLVTEEQLRDGIAEPVQDIVDAVTGVFDRMPPELTPDIVARGIVLTGGGALLSGLDRRIQEETGVQVHVDPEPLSCVARGAGILLERL